MAAPIGWYADRIQVSRKTEKLYHHIYPIAVWRTTVSGVTGEPHTVGLVNAGEGTLSDVSIFHGFSGYDFCTICARGGDCDHHAQLIQIHPATEDDYENYAEARSKS